MGRGWWLWWFGRRKTPAHLGRELSPCAAVFFLFVFPKGVISEQYETERKVT